MFLYMVVHDILSKNMPCKLCNGIKIKIKIKTFIMNE